MKNPIALWLAFGGIACAAPEAGWTAWQWLAPVEIGQAGMVRLELPPPVLDVSRPGLPDIRMLSPTGVETSYLIEGPARSAGSVRDAVGFKVFLSGRTTVIEVAAGTAEAIEAVELVSPAREFLKSVRIEASKDGGEWRMLAANEVIFRQAGGTEHLMVPLPPEVWQGFRLTVDDGRSQPVPFTGVRVLLAGEKPATVELPVVLGKREEISGETRLALDLGASNLNVAGLSFEIPDAVFSRACGLAFAKATAAGGSRLEMFASGVLYRVVGDGGGSTEALVMPLRQRIAARSLVATFRNGDSPPLTITGARVRCYPTVVAFHAAEAGAWRLLTGNRDVKAPDYDLNPLRAALSAAGGQRIMAGPLRPKADYQVTAALPGIEPAGANIGLADWTRRRAVDPVSAGVIRIELDALTLAASRLDLGDLRLVQNGRQLPYLIKPDTVSRGLKPTMIPMPLDPKRPTVSRWELTLPADGVPAVDLTALSPAPLFARRFVAQIERRDELGNVWTEHAGAADWTKSGGVDVPLVLNLGRSRLPRRLVLETDHGDNPPIAVDHVMVRFAAPSITAKVTDDAALYLYYGNPKAVPPQYDLRLVRKELLAADPQAAGLLEEEMLRPAAGGNRGVDAGSPWLWLALGVVVVALLSIVAKLLPRPAAA